MSLASRYLINNGQGCICAKHFLVATPLLEAFTKAFVEQSEALPMGDPMRESIKLGPLARADLRRNVHRQVRDAVKAGARVLTGGEIPDGPGNFYPPTVLNDRPPEAAIAKEEFFGPVAVIYAFETEDKAVEIRRSTTARAKRRSATKSPEVVKDNQSDPPYRIVRARHKRAGDAHE
jgi:acyl-CoA reductase-like NAD-dependent aldehyde dehydrogenase